MRIHSLLLFVFLLFFLSPATSEAQEIVAIHQAPPELRLYFKTADNLMFQTDIANLASLADRSSPPNIRALNNQELLGMMDLVPEQKEQLKLIQNRIQERSKELAERYRESLDGSDEDGSKLEIANQYFKELVELKNEISMEIRDVVTLPFQDNVVLQFEFQLAAKRTGFYKAILTKPFVENLELDAEQREKIEEIVEKTDQAIAKQIEKLRGAAKAEIVRVLNPKQKEYVEVVSKPLSQPGKQ